MRLPPIIGSDTVLTFLKPFGRGFSLTTGDIVKAEVINAMQSGLVSIRITQGNGERGIIAAKTSVPLENGDTVLLKVIGGDKEIRLQLMEILANGETAEDANAAEVPKAVLAMLSELSGSRINSTDLNIVRDIFRSLPQEIRVAYPEVESIGQLLPEVERLNASLLRTSVEGSGVLFEARLKLAAQEVMQGYEGGILPRLFPGPDLKGLLLKFRELLKDETMAESLRSSGRTAADAANVVDRLIENVEFFQLTSRLHDVFYTFLPVSWQDLRDGELTLREGRSGEDRSHTCDITLDLESVGRLSVSVTLFGGAFNVSFHAERADTASLLASGKGDLEKRFRESGLPLRIVNVGRRTAINFRVIKPQGFDVRV